jgi:hypothetical protein
MSAVAESRIFIVKPRPDPLLARAQQNYPDSEYLQREWLRAVSVVRKTSQGWVADRLVPRVAR